MGYGGTNWLAHLVRITLFPAPGFPRGMDLWQELFGTEPEQEEARRREGFRQQRGPFREGVVNVASLPPRVDVVLSPKQSAQISPEMGHVEALEAASNVQVSVGVFSAELAALQGRVAALLARLPLPVQRIALGGTAIAEANSVEDANRILGLGLKSLRVAPEAMRDLIYRVNWRKKSSVSDIDYYNRITTWTASTLGLIVGSAGTPGFSSIETRHFASLEIDINTPLDRQGPLQSDHLGTALSEVHGLAQDILRDGECTQE